MSNKYRVAVVGATGAVGETMLSILAERRFPVGELVADEVRAVLRAALPLFPLFPTK